MDGYYKGVKMTGQITRSQLFGDLLYKYAKSDDIKNIVEVGTWNGMGSTKCIIDGLLERTNDNYNFITIELYPEQYQLALKNLSNYLSDKIRILNGKLIEYDEVFWFDHSKLNMEDAHAKLWYDKDMQYIKEQPNIIDELPKTIDLLVLDGGEYTTYPEYKKLKSRSRIIALDDTAIHKCSQIRNELISEGHRIVCDRLHERNGWTIFEVKREHYSV